MIAVSQIAGTWALISAFRTRNFAVAVTFSKTETLQTAFLSLVIIGEPLPTVAWVAIALSVVGVAALTRPTGRHGLDGATRRALREGAAYGLGSGLLFGLSATAIRSASMTPAWHGHAHALARDPRITTSLQFLFLGSFLLVREPGGFAGLFRAWRVAAVVGLTSVAGSAGWFTAITLQKAAYVQVVGQIEIVLSILVSRLIFREGIHPSKFSARFCSRRAGAPFALGRNLTWRPMGFEPTENTIAAARHFLNAAVNEYNSTLRRFPANFIAGRARLRASFMRREGLHRLEQVGRSECRCFSWTSISATAPLAAAVERHV